MMMMIVNTNEPLEVNASDRHRRRYGCDNLAAKPKIQFQ